MDTITIYDGLILTVVAMLVVFIVLALIWGFVELVAKLLPNDEPVPEPALASNVRPTPHHNTNENPKHKKAAEITALVLASEDEPDKKFEIVESKRIR